MSHMSMIFESTSNHISEQESMEQIKVLSKKQRIKKNVNKRKMKNADKEEQNNSSTNSDKTKLTKEQKLQLQKIKNRQSAQRSRDQRKKQIEDLLYQNEKLKLQNETLTRQNGDLRKRLADNICSRCRNQPESHTCETNMQNQIVYQEQEIPMTDQSRYERLTESSSSFKLPLFLLVCCLAITIFSINPTSSSELEETRRLFTIADLAATQANLEYQDKYISQNRVINQEASSTLVPINVFHESCLTEYIQNKRMISNGIVLRNNLRRPKPSQNNLLLCRMPHLVKHNKSEHLLQNELQILMRASELNPILLEETSNPLLTKTDESKSVYLLRVEIKQIQKYYDFECVL